MANMIRRGRRKAPQTIITIIVEAARARRTVRLWYVSSKGEVSIRETEPYEIKEGKYWGYCLERGSIRQFALDSIRDAIITDNTFSPRWPVKL